MKQRFRLLILTIFFVTACSDSTSSVEDNQTEVVNEQNSTLTGKVIDGEISGATVFNTYLNSSKK
jgi:outer membrane biogenesis lipoprotein LolB